MGTFVTQKFRAQGSHVVGASRRITQQDYPATNFTALELDFTDANGVRVAVESVIAKFGRLDVLVHVLGGFAGGKSIADTDDATWAQMRDLNLSTAFYVLHAAIPYLRKSGRGRVIAIDSLAATDLHAGIGGYVTFKSALSMLVSTVALENREAGLTANVILPGTIDTPANRRSMPDSDFSKWLQPDGVAALALWLADEHAGHITGAILPIVGSNG